MPMDICSHIGLSVTDDVNNLHGLCMNTPKSTHGVLQDFSVDELGNGVTQFLNIQDDRKDNLASKKSELQKKDASQESRQSKIITGASENCLSDNDKSADPPGFCSISPPRQSKAVSAMKGSREKRGAVPPTKLTVKWAPDVYDPIPTSVSHMVTTNRSSRHSSKRNSKNKQKNASKSSSSRGSKSKDKKQTRKRRGNSSSTGYKSSEHEEAVDFHEPESSVIDFRVGNPDQFCGSSFLKRYGTGLHLSSSSVAEAT